MTEPNVHPVAALFPMLSDDELADLAADIAANGQLYPIVLDANGQLIDGRNRLAACKVAGVKPRFETLGANQNPVAYILATNVRRRHLSKGQRAMAVALARLSESDNGRMTQHEAAHLSGASQAAIAEAETVAQWAPDLTQAVMTGGRLDEAYGRARERKQRQDAEAQELTRLRRDAPDLAVRVQAGVLTLGQARAAVDAMRRESHEAAEVTRLVEAVSLTREEIGTPVPLPPEPDLTIRFTTDAAGEVATPEYARGNRAIADALEREHEFLKRVIAARDALQAIAAEPVLTDLSWREGHLNAIRSSVSQIVAAAYQLVAAHDAVLSERPALREVK